MINKFQQGGNILLQLALELAANGVSQEVILQLAQNQELWGQLVLIYQQQGILGVANALNLLSKKTLQTKAMRHGAKLQYLKSLKHQCAEDEEVVYYKNGGLVDCGCKKKEIKKDGGEVTKAQNGTVANFKAKMQNKKTTAKLKEGWDKNGNYIVTKAGVEERRKLLEANKNEEGEAAPKKQETKSQPKSLSKQPIKKECGGAVAKFKKHRLGGSLNGIPFMQKGTSKEGIEFQENLEPPTYGVFGELGRNLEQGSKQFGKIIGSPATLILLTGLGSGITGIVGPTVRILKDTKTALGSKSGFRNAVRKISRNLNAKKGSPEFKWIRTSGDIKKGGAIDRSFNGMGRQTEKMVHRASRSEGSGYNAQQILNDNPIYQLARSNPQSLGWKPYHTPANNLAYTTSNRVFKRNRLIDQARDWRNWIFE